MSFSSSVLSAGREIHSSPYFHFFRSLCSFLHEFVARPNSCPSGRSGAIALGGRSGAENGRYSLRLSGNLPILVVDA
eukprot:1608531-Alexandrium_andersonii.AAC.1